ncbi:MAG: DegV family protein [Eubacteriales bacterium]|nr:DegV family protein [Eubacteriales bacterium]
MADYIISCCSIADLSREHLDKRNISYVYFHYTVDDKTYDDDLGLTMSIDEFYKAMEEGAMTSTAQVNQAEYTEYFERLLSSGKDVIHLTLSSGLSGSYNSARLAAEELKDKYPNQKLYVVDSLGASSGVGLIAETLADMRDEGKTIDELYTWIEENKLKMHHWFFSTDLKYYVRGGRISKVAGLFGGILGICPLLNCNLEGKLTPRQKIRGKEKVKCEIVEKMVKHAQGGLNYSGKCFICHSACPDDAKDVAKEIESRFKNLNGKVVINSIGPTIGSHTGPGTVAVFFWGDERVD